MASHIRRYGRHNDHQGTTFGSDVRYSRRSATGAYTAGPALTPSVSTIESAPRRMSGPRSGVTAADRKEDWGS